MYKSYSAVPTNGNKSESFQCLLFPDMVFKLYSVFTFIRISLTPELSENSEWGLRNAGMRCLLELKQCDKLRNFFRLRHLSLKGIFRPLMNTNTKVVSNFLMSGKWWFLKCFVTSASWAIKEKGFQHHSMVQFWSVKFSSKLFKTFSNAILIFILLIILLHTYFPFSIVHLCIHLWSGKIGRADGSDQDWPLFLRSSTTNRLIVEVVQSWRRPLLGPSPGWKRLLALSHLRHFKTLC